MSAGRQPTALDVSVVKLASQCVVNIKGDAYARALGGTREDRLLDGLHGSAGERWIPAH
ncbi:hypothetical protein METHPM2_160006 [Pseudomonas sp. PM2]